MSNLALSDLIVGLGIAMLIEGALYALFPGAMQRLMTLVLEQGQGPLRLAGLSLAVIGLGLVWLIRG
jgi:hypothetical protein